MKVVDTWQTEQHEDSAVPSVEHDRLVAHVRVLTGESPPALYRIDAQGVSIGRTGGGCDVTVHTDVRISRKHARIERSIAGWQIQDLNSRNGFFLNGRGFGPGERVPLPDGGVLRIGDTLMVFRALAPPTDDRVRSAAFPGSSPGAAEVRRRIDELAASSGHVLILGETGTGKERVAKAIGDARAPHPLVTLNCAQLTRDLARSELFGHARGAFTDAVRSKPGLVDMAGEGTLFLDEIGDLPLDVQAELLRYLEDGSYRALGSPDLRHSHARVVAATNINLDQAVSNGRFRRDLLARLRASNTPLELPALRERREDILGWTHLFFGQIGRDPGPQPWSAGALECLLLFPWEENLRYLLSVVNHVATQTLDFPCAPEHLPAMVREHRGMLRAQSAEVLDDPTPVEAPPLRQTDPEASEIDDAFRKTEGNVRQAAQVLNIDRRRLYRLCERYRLDPRTFRKKK